MDLYDQIHQCSLQYLNNIGCLVQFDETPRMPTKRAVHIFSLCYFCYLKMESLLNKLAETEVPESQEGKGALVMKLKQRLIEQIKTMLFNNTTSVVGGEDVRELFKTFQKNILSVNPLYGRSDEEIWKLQRKLEGVGAPLGDSSENSQLLELLLHEKFHLPNGKRHPISIP